MTDKLYTQAELDDVGKQAWIAAIAIISGQAAGLPIQPLAKEQLGHAITRRVKEAVAAAEEAVLLEVEELVGDRGDRSAEAVLDEVIHKRQLIGALARHDAEIRKQERERAATECDRHAKFCKAEWDNGGDAQHLSARYAEANYLAQRIRAALSDRSEQQTP